MIQTYWDLFRGDKNLPLWPTSWVLFQTVLRRTFLRENWQGIYSHLSELPPAKEAFEKKQWLTPLYLSTKNIKNCVEIGKSIPANHAHEFLASITRDLLKDTKSLRIVDVGGGMGNAYLYLRSAGIPLSKIDYFVMEIEAVSRLAKELLVSYDHLSFGAAPVQEFQEADIVYVSTALQYFSDFRETLRMICSWKPKHLVMDKLSAGSIPTFLTRQKTLPGASIPYWFINREALIQCLGADYTLEREETALPVPSMKNFPAEYRLTHYRRMHFERNLLS